MNPGPDKVLYHRFLSKCDNMIVGQCWNWIGASLKNSYGQFHYEGKTWLSHRVAWTLFNGEIPSDKHVLHKCDNRKCVNPDHLFIGTRSDNMRDCVAKGRHKSCKYNKAKTHCPNSHRYSGKNLILEKNGWRKCRICTNKNQNYRRRVN